VRAESRDAVLPTTLLEAPGLSRILGLEVLLATETFQVTGSFKFRAAHNVARSVPHPLIITASSGNFGQALACACAMHGKRCIVVMPHTSARVKVEAVSGYGAEVDLIDTRAISRAARVAELARQHSEAYVASAYDDALVIEGNASLGRELAARASDFDLVVAPIGGGGLTAGILRGLRAAGSPSPLYAAEPLLGNDAARSLREGRIVANETEPATLADGARTLSVGKLNWEILRDGLAGVIEVPEESIARAVRLLFLHANLKAEPTGALAIGALLASPDRFANQRVCCVISGGNVDPALYADLIA
jgi:threonine dehydratase